MKGEKTLFVVGVRDPKEIAQKADEHKIKHLYFGTSQSFVINKEEDLKPWVDMMKSLLDKDFWVTLDFGIEYMEQVTATGLMSSKKFIPMISAKIPNIYKINGNATLKIDDVTWGHSNTGVWSRNLKEITDAMHYTDWKEYVGDTVIDVDTDE